MFRKLSVLLIPLLFLYSTGCTEKSTQSNQENAVFAEGGTVVIALEVEPESLNPLFYRSSYSGQILTIMHDSMLEMGEDFTYQSNICDELIWSEDSLSITVSIKEWLWSNGTIMTADDIVSSCELYKNPELACPRLSDAIRNIKSVEAIDNQTVCYKFESVRSDMVSALGHFIFSPSDRDAIINDGRLVNTLVNESGIYVLSKWDHDSSLVLERNENYSGKHSNLERVIFKIIPDETSRAIALETGEVDVLNNIPPHIANRLSSVKEVVLHNSPGRLVGMLTWNLENPVFKDPTVRKALSLAIDRERIVEDFLYGFGSVGKGPIPPASWAHDAKILPDNYNPERSKRMLDKAGWVDSNGDGIRDKDGVDLEFKIITKKGDSVRENSLIMLRENFCAIGANVECSVAEFSSMIEQVRSGNFDSYLRVYSSRMSVNPSALYASGPSSRFNYGNYSSELVDAFLRLALAETDREKATKLWHKFEFAVVADPPAAFLYYPHTIVGVSERVQNVKPHVLSSYNNIREWWIAKEDRKYFLNTD
ncbi:MAG: hypothetical protein GY752_10720 [bacterium]|nr:hypothetical protein [bacterium]MCP4800257.1 hypothetical protein [bacterium]